MPDSGIKFNVLVTEMEREDGMKKVTILLLVLLMITSSAGTAFANSAYYRVSGNSMYPILQDGDLVEIVSETYQDGDMVVAVKKDGTKIVKRLMGNRLVSVHDGTSYAVDEVTILGAARYAPMSPEELEAYGFRWETVLAEGEYIEQIAAGGQHTLALTNTGVVYAWGRNNYGQLGDDSNEQRNTPEGGGWRYRGWKYRSKGDRGRRVAFLGPERGNDICLGSQWRRPIGKWLE